MQYPALLWPALTGTRINPINLYQVNRNLAALRQSGKKPLNAEY
jgi:hypothetical protein